MGSTSQTPPVNPSSNEAKLIQRACRGDRRAFGELYERHLHGVYRYIYYRLGNIHEAEDLTETVFLKAWEALPRYQATQAPFAAWLFRIAHNALVDYYRAQRPTSELSELHPASGDGTDPENEAAEQEQRSLLMRALRQLDRAHQEILTLRFLNGLSHAEAADILGRSEGAVRVLQHRALAALRKLLGGKGKSND